MSEYDEREDREERAESGREAAEPAERQDASPERDESPEPVDERPEPAEPTEPTDDVAEPAEPAEPADETLAENRKYGEGLVIVEQVPSKLIEDALKNTATKIMHHLPAPDDRESVAATMSLSEDQITYAQALDPMTAYVTHRAMGGRAGLIDVVDVRGDAARAAGVTESPLPDSLVMRNRFEILMAERQDLWNGLAPYPECAKCRHRCQFRGVSEVTAPASAEFVRQALSRKNHPKEQADRDRVWLELVEHYWQRVNSYPEYTHDQQEDFAACSFMHAAFAAFPGKNVSWLVDRYRATANGTATP